MRADRPAEDEANVSLGFGEALRTYRRRAAMSQEELAHRAALHRTEIGLLERGQREPGLSTVVKLAAALDVSLDDLLGGLHWSVARRGFEIDAEVGSGRGS